MGKPTLLFYMEDVREKIRGVAAPLADEQGVSIEGVELAGNLRRLTVRVFIDKEGGVTLEDCERFSRSLSVVLDVEDFIRSSYVLEVSSPGLDRPLKSVRDFEKSIGKLARVVTRESIEKQNFFVGRISGVREETIMLMVDGKGEIAIPYDFISRARLEIEIK